MSMSNKVVSVYGDEPTFIANFIKSVMHESVFSSQHTLSCKVGDVSVSTDNDVDTQLNTVFSTSSNYPSFTFVIDTRAEVTFRRYATAGSSGYDYEFNAKFNGVSIPFSPVPSIAFLSGRAEADNKDTVKTRMFRYQIFSSQNVLFIAFGGFNDTFPLNSSSNNNTSAFVYKKTTNGVTDYICGSTPSLNLKNTAMEEVEMANRLNYVNNSADPTSIEVIQNKVVLRSADRSKFLVMDNVWDSSYNSAVMFPVTISSNNYVYLDNYTLMPI